MRRLYVSLGLVALLAALCTVHTVYLSRFTGRLTQQLTQAQEDWTAHEGYLHTTLRHTDIDAILISFDEALSFLQAGERQSAEYAAVNARLITQIGLLIEAELPTLPNLL